MPSLRGNKKVDRRRLTTAANRLAIDHMRRLNVSTLVPISPLGASDSSSTLLAETRSNAFKRYVVDLCSAADITHVSFRDSGLAPEDFVVLRHALADHPSIETIDLSHNEVDDTAARTILSIVSDNKLIISIDLEETGISERYQNEIQTVVDANARRKSALMERRERRTKLRVETAVATKFSALLDELRESEAVERGAVSREELRSRHDISSTFKKGVRTITCAAECARMLAIHEEERATLQQQESTWRDHFANTEETEIRAIVEGAAIIVHGEAARAQQVEFEKMRRAERTEWVRSCRRERRRSEHHVSARATLVATEHQARLAIIVNEQGDWPDMRDAEAKSKAEAKAAESRNQHVRREEAQRKAREKDEQARKLAAAQREKAEEDEATARANLSQVYTDLCTIIQSTLDAMGRLGVALARLSDSQCIRDGLLRESPILQVSDKHNRGAAPICFRSTWQTVPVCPVTAITVAMRPQWQSEAQNSIAAADEAFAAAQSMQQQCSMAFTDASAKLSTGTWTAAAPASSSHDQAVDISPFVLEISNCCKSLFDDASKSKVVEEALRAALTGQQLPHVQAIQSEKERVLAAHVTVSVADADEEDHLYPTPADHAASLLVPFRFSQRKIAEARCTVTEQQRLASALARRRTAFVSNGRQLNNNSPLLDDANSNSKKFPPLIPSQATVEADFYVSPVLSNATMFLQGMLYHSTEEPSSTHLPPTVKHFNVVIEVEANYSQHCSLPQHLTARASYHAIVADPYLYVDRSACISTFIEGTAAEASPLLHAFTLAATPIVTEAAPTTCTDDGGGDQLKGAKPCTSCGGISVAPASADFSYSGFTIIFGFVDGHDVYDRIVMAQSDVCWLSHSTKDDDDPTAAVSLFVKLPSEEEVCIGHVAKGELSACSNATRQSDRESRQAITEISVTAPTCTTKHLEALLSSLRYFCSGMPLKSGSRQVVVELVDSSMRCCCANIWIDAIPIKTVAAGWHEAPCSRQEKRRAILSSAARGDWSCTVFPFFGMHLYSADEAIDHASFELSCQWTTTTTDGSQQTMVEPPKHAFHLNDDTVATAVVQAAVEAASSGGGRTVELPAARSIRDVAATLQTVRMSFFHGELDCTATCIVNITFTLRDGTTATCVARQVIDVAARPAADSSSSTVMPPKCICGSAYRPFANAGSWSYMDSQQVPLVRVLSRKASLTSQDTMMCNASLALQYSVLNRPISLPTVAEFDPSMTSSDTSIAATLSPVSSTISTSYPTHVVHIWIDIIAGAEPGDALSMSMPAAQHSSLSLRRNNNGDGDEASSSAELLWCGIHIGSVHHCHQQLLPPHGGLQIVVSRVESFPAMSIAMSLLDSVTFVAAAATSNKPTTRVLRASISIEAIDEAIAISVFREVRCISATTITSAAPVRELLPFVAVAESLKPRCRITDVPIPVMPLASFSIDSADYYDGGSLTVDLTTSAGNAHNSLALLSPSLQAVHAAHAGRATADHVLEVFNVEFDEKTNALTCDVLGHSHTVGEFRTRTGNQWVLDFPVASPPIITPRVVEFMMASIGVACGGGDSWRGFPHRGNCVFHLCEPTSVTGAAATVDLLVAAPLVRIAQQPATTIEAANTTSTAARLIWTLLPDRRHPIPVTLQLQPVVVGDDEKSHLAICSGDLMVDGSKLMPRRSPREDDDDFPTTNGTRWNPDGLSLSVEVGADATRQEVREYERVLRSILVERSSSSSSSGEVPQKVVGHRMHLSVESPEGMCQADFYD